MRTKENGVAGPDPWDNFVYFLIPPKQKKLQNLPPNYPADCQENNHGQNLNMTTPV